MKLICTSCLHEYEGSIFRDELGWHGVCPDCGASFPIDLPTGLIVMAFTDDSNPDKDWENFTDDFADTASIRTYYVFNSVAEFAEVWRKMAGSPDGMWYFVLYKGKQVVSGAYDDGDEDYFKDDMDGWPTE